MVEALRDPHGLRQRAVRMGEDNRPAIRRRRTAFPYGIARRDTPRLDATVLNMAATRRAHLTPVPAARTYRVDTAARPTTRTQGRHR